MKGIVLAGGFGSRLAPLTDVVNKHLLPVYDKPMIFYPLTCLAKSSIQEVAVLTGGRNAELFEPLLGDGSQFGLKLSYIHQERAGGIAYALGLARDFAEGQSLCLALGDNICEHVITPSVKAFEQQTGGARILLSKVDQPQHYGIAELVDQRIHRIVEKPTAPIGNLAVVGIYLYDQQVFDIVDTIALSQRGELEITDVNNAYLQRGELEYDVLPGWWIDAGEDVDQYLEASNLVAEYGANHPIHGS